MNRLLNVNRPNGYPLVGENLKIISEDYHNYLNAILAGLQLPIRRCVFLQLNQTNGGKLADSIAYVTPLNTFGPNTTGNIVAIKGNGDISVADLLSGSVSCTISNVSQNYDIENEAGVFSSAYNINYCNVHEAMLPMTIYKFMMLDDAIRMRMETPTKQLDLAQCKFWVGGEIDFDDDGIITGVSPLDSQYAGFAGSDNSIERIGNFLKLNFGYFGTIAGGDSGLDGPKNIIELPIDFVNFSKITKLNAIVVPGNYISHALVAPVLRAVIYKNYIIMEATSNTYHNVVDYIPIV